MNVRTESPVLSWESGELPLEAESSSGVGAVLAETKAILEAVPKTGEYDDIAESVAERIQASPEVMRIAQAEIDFTRRQAELRLARKKAFEKLRAQVQKVLLSVLTATTLQGAPVKAETSFASEEISHEAILKERLEASELSYEVLFDQDSPLNVVSEKFSKQPLSREDIAILQWLREQVFQEHEWATLSGKDRFGRYTTELFRGWEDGVMISYVGTKLHGVRQVTEMHTHPPSQDLRGLAQNRKDQGKSFLHPPSSKDLRICMYNKYFQQSTKYRAVDPHGVWEYQCDRNNPLVLSERVAFRELQKALSFLRLQFGLASDDAARLDSALDKVERGVLLELKNDLEQLDRNYPGIAAAGNVALNNYIEQARGFTEVLLDNDALSLRMIAKAGQFTDSQLAVEIQYFIRAAEKNGIYMSYTPFKELSKREGEK